MVGLFVFVFVFFCLTNTSVCKNIQCHLLCLVGVPLVKAANVSFVLPVDIVSTTLVKAVNSFACSGCQIHTTFVNAANVSFATPIYAISTTLLNAANAFCCCFFKSLVFFFFFYLL